MTPAALLLVYPALGLGAGTLTTIAGQGGGLLLLLACAALTDPHQALAITAPALLLGNLHRSLLLRRSIVWPIAGRVIVGGLPGALLGGVVVGLIPLWALRALLVTVTMLAIAKAAGLFRFHVPRAALVSAGVVIGGMTGTAGGAGVLFAPLLLSAGLSGSAYVGTASAIALATHVGRVAGYASQGLFERELLLPTILVTLAIFAGNAVGDRLRGADGADGSASVKKTWLEYGVLVVCVSLSVAGLG